MAQIYRGSSKPASAIPYLSRPRIDNLIGEALQKPLTTVIAGAGYGKTHACSSALASMGRKYAWLQLSELDNMISILWRRLVFSIATFNSKLAMRLNALGPPDSPASFYQLQRQIEGELRQKGPFILALDDFHLIQDSNVLDFFEKLISANIADLSLLLISREKPQLPLAGMLSKGLLSRIVEDDLRFTQDEMESYYQLLLGEVPSPESSAGLYEYTEGWVLAIYLVGLAHRRGNGHHHGAISRARVDIFSLIEEEVFCPASQALQQLLIGISLLDAVPAGLMRDLAEDSPGILDEMFTSGLLIRYDPHADCYRMHRLFKEYLAAKRAELTDEQIAQIHLVTARWYQRNNRPEEAMDHYRHCGHFDEVFDIILSVRTHVSRDTANLFISLIDEAPARFIEQRPIMRVVKAKYLFNNNEIQQAEDILNGVRTEYEASPAAPDRIAILGEVYVLLALISIVKQNLEFVDLFKRADECLPGGSALIAKELNIAEGINATGIKDPVPGALAQYEAALFEAAPYSARVMNGCGYGMEYLNAADAAFMTGDIKSAEKHAYEAVYRAKQQQQFGFEFMAYFYLVRIFMYKGDYQSIANMLNLMKEKTAQLQCADCATLYDIIEGWFFVKVGQPGKVAEWIMREDEARKIMAPVILGREYLVRSDCLLTQGQDYELLGYMKHSDVFYEQRGILYARIQNRITESIVHHYLGNRAESLDALQSAYELSQANGLVIQYIEYGSKMRTVVQAALQDENCRIPRPWLEEIQTKSSTYAKRLAQVVKRYNADCHQGQQAPINLSKRELEVLSCLCQGFTRDEIADACELSSNTVRGIQQNVFNKLGAINSLDAVRIATMMKLV